jgi:hypothetical protein
MRMSTLASSSHTGPVGELGCYLQHFRQCFGRNTAAEALVDLIQAHAHTKTLQDMRHRQAGPPDRGFASQQV